MVFWKTIAVLPFGMAFFVNYLKTLYDQKRIINNQKASKSMVKKNKNNDFNGSILEIMGGKAGEIQALSTNKNVLLV